MTAGGRTAESLALSVHGPVGVLDLLAPPGATAADVAREYAEQTGAGVGDHPVPPVLHRLGTPLDPDRPLIEAGVRAGEVLVAAPPAAPGSAPVPAESPGPAPGAEPGAVWALCCALAGAAAVLAAWGAAGRGGAPRDVVGVLLAAGALLGLLPVGRLAWRRVLVAPVLAGAAAFVAAGPERLPLAVGLAGLVAGLVAGLGAIVGRPLDDRAAEGLRVWMVAGAGVFAVTGPATLAGLRPEVSWGVLLLLATLAARLVPAVAVDVPDQYLLDLDRLAVTAWSAREQPRRRRRGAVPTEAVERVVARGGRTVTAAAAAILGVVAVSAPLLLATATVEIDRLGARALVALCGAALLLAARSHRHPGARALLRLAGLAAWTSLAVVLLPDLAAGPATAFALGCVALGAALVLAAIGTGRGWRSAWWARCAEIAEGAAGSLAIGALLVAVGIFRSLWETTS
ncbi:hypothetical protein [Nocardioides pantholopis]|uniref:hypothetical protein n=1 Tax=Nocardioides pantholopis TaxID=2483798 RepID=UPI000FD8A1DD|nr:hypothetical protein [Nocardioides pantholopis]